MQPAISFEDIMKVEMRVGEIVRAEAVEDSVKLIKMTVNFGDEIGQKTIFAGIKKWYAPEELMGKRTVFFMNLKPKKMGEAGHSEGMLTAVEVMVGEEQTAVLLLPDREVPLGSRVL